MKKFIKSLLPLAVAFFIFQFGTAHAEIKSSDFTAFCPTNIGNGKKEAAQYTEGKGPHLNRPICLWSRNGQFDLHMLI